MSTPRHALLVLAAGGSRRLGQAKQLLRLEGETLVRRAARLGLATAPSEARVVCGAGADAIWSEVADLGLRRVDCAGWAEGLGASLAAGVDTLSCDCEGVLVLLCDQPALDIGHLLALRDAWRGQPGRACASEYAGVLGVPALMPRAWFDPLSRLRGDRGARDLLASRASEVIGVKAVDLAWDIDHPGDALALGTRRRQE